jgi:hypothetical protein
VVTIYDLLLASILGVRGRLASVAYPFTFDISMSQIQYLHFLAWSCAHDVLLIANNANVYGKESFILTESEFVKWDLYYSIATES